MSRSKLIAIAITSDGRNAEVLVDYGLNEVERSFLEACENFDLDKVRECIDRGVDVNVRSEDLNWFGLKYAAADQDFTDESVELCNILLSHPDIDVQNKDSFGDTALVTAAENLLDDIAMLTMWFCRSWSMR